MLRQSAAAALAATPYHSLACEMPLMKLLEACFRARDVQETVETARFLHASLNCSGLSAIGTILGLASGKVHAQAAEPSATVETKAARRALAQIIDQIIAQIGSMPSATATEPAEIAEIAEIATRIARLLDDVLASLKGRWGTLKAHNAIAAFLIDGVEPELARLAKKAPIFEIGVVPVYGAVVTLGASFIVPRSFGPAANGANGANGANRAVGPNAILFVKAAEAAEAEKAAGAAGAAEAEKPEKPEWVPITLSTVRSEYAATVGFYRALYDAINTRPDIVAHIRAILLDVPRIAATPWHSVLSDGTFTLVPLVHLQPTTGLAVNQLAIVPMAVTPELASAMAAIVATMTKAEANGAEPTGAEAAEPNGAFEPSGFSYFTIAPAPPAASAAVKRCLTGLTGLTGLTDDDVTDEVTDGAAPPAKSGREETDGAN